LGSALYATSQHPPLSQHPLSIAMRLRIPPIPPFVMGDLWEGENEADGDVDDDFIADLELELDTAIEGVDFALEFEKELERNASSDAALSSAALNRRLDFEDKQEEEGGEAEKSPKRRHGKCVEGYLFGNIFSSCWYIKFLSPDRDGVEGTRSCT
jgi:hypothetical protein